MGFKVPPINVRLPGDAGERFTQLCAEFPGLPHAVVAKILLTGALEKPLEEQIRNVIAGIRKPAVKGSPKHSPTHSLNRLASER